MRTALATVALIVAFSSAAEAQLTWTQSPVNGHWYAKTAPLTWPNAEAVAVAVGGHLATVRSQSENDWIYNTFCVGTVLGVLIGFNDVAQEGTWTWSSGETVVYTNWAAGEPNDINGGEDYAHLAGSYDPGKWNDAVLHSSMLEGLIEVESDDCNLDGIPDVAQGAGPYPKYGTACAAASGHLPTLAACGNATPGGAVLVTLSDAAPAASALFLIGNLELSVPAGGPCVLLVNPVLPIVPSFTTGGQPGVPGSGGLVLPLPIPAQAVPSHFTMQAFVADDGQAWGYSASNGVKVLVQ